jgi:hypothetical protein
LRYEIILPMGNSDDVGGRRADIGSSSSFIDNTTSWNTGCVTIHSHPIRSRADGECCGNTVLNRRAWGESGGAAVSTGTKE